MNAILSSTELIDVLKVVGKYSSIVTLPLFVNVPNQVRISSLLSTAVFIISWIPLVLDEKKISSVY